MEPLYIFLMNETLWKMTCYFGFGRTAELFVKKEEPPRAVVVEPLTPFIPSSTARQNAGHRQPVDWFHEGF
jgi:hypothetical protein